MADGLFDVGGVPLLELEHYCSSGEVESSAAGASSDEERPPTVFRFESVLNTLPIFDRNGPVVPQCFNAEGHPQTLGYNIEISQVLRKYQDIVDIVLSEAQIAEDIQEFLQLDWPK